jgi:Tfp pilus assembly protein PilF
MATNDAFVDEVSIVKHLKDVVGSTHFRRAPGLCGFLRFIVTETLAGRGDHLKEYSVGVNVFSRRSDFDPKQDSIVRVEAVKLRSRLVEYYRSSNINPEVRILLEKGSYKPEFRVCRSLRNSSDADLLTQLIASADLAIWRRTPDAIALARKNLSKVIELEPSDARGHIGLAESYRAALDMEFESPADLLPCYERELAIALRLAPGNGLARVLRSNFVCAMKGVDQMALDEIDDVLLLNSSSARAHFWRSAVLSATGNHPEAIREIREAMRLEPQSILFHVYAARLLLYARQAEEAAEKLDEVVKLDPALAVAHLWLALALVEIGQFDRAIRAAFSMVSLGDNAVARSCLTYVLARAGYRGDAAQHLEELLATPTPRYFSPVWFAAISEALGKRQTADEQIRAAITEKSYPLIWLRNDPRLRTWT